MMSFSIPSAVDLSVCVGITCCGYPIFSSVTLIGSPALALWNNAPAFASTSYDITYFMMLESVSIYPLDLLVLLKF